MQRSCTFLVPGDWDSRTGGYLYDRRIVDQLRTAGWQVDVLSPGDGFPWPDAAAAQRARQVVAALPDGALVRGRAVACRGNAAASLALALAAQATTAGAWLAVVDVP